MNATRTSTMPTRSTVAIGALATLILGACGGGDKLSESFIENQIEQAGGGDADVDFDLDGDGGGFSIKTDEGELSIKTDKDGNVSIEGLDADGDDFSIQSDGQGNVSAEGLGGDGDGGDGDGDGDDFSIKSDDGELVLEGDDGTSIIGGQGTELPDNFPSEIPLPDGLVLEYSQVADTPDGPMFTVLGAAPGELQTIGDDMVAELESNGWTQLQITTTPDGGIYSFDNGELTMYAIIGADPSTDGTSISLTVAPSGG